MLKQKLDSTLWPVVLFALLVVYLLVSDPATVGPF